MDDLGKLFEAIRKEEVILFVGAGLSRCAGLPSGSELSNVIFNELAEELQKEIDNNRNDLPIVADAFVNSNLNGKEKLINLIQQNFEYRYPNDRKSPLHSIISGIPHFRTIITTNYDELLEVAHDRDCVIIACNEEVANAKRKTTNIIKLHGDFLHRNNIIVTKSDYDSFYCDRALNQPLWTLVKERLATHTILFLGYGLDDGNVNSIVTEWIGRHLSSSRNPMYLIAPSISQVKANELTAKGINYINKTAEEFLPLLKSHLDKNVAHDVERGYTTMDTADKYARNQAILQFEGNRVVNAKPAYANIRERLTFRTSDQDIWRQLQDPDNFDSIHITDISDAAHFVGELDIPLFAIKEITVLHHPTAEFNSTIYFPHNDFEIREIPSKSYIGKTKLKGIMSLKGGEITIDAQKGKKVTASVSCEPHSDTINILDEIEWLMFIKLVGEGHSFNLTTNHGIMRNLQLNLTSNDDMDNANIRLEYLQKLVKIERHYGVRFQEVKAVTQANEHNVDLILRNIDGDIVEQTGDIFVRVTIDSCNKFQREYTFKPERMLSIRREPDIVNLHGVEIHLGYLIAEVRDPQYIDLDQAKDDGEIEVNLTAKAGTYRAFFQQENPFLPNGALKKKYLAM